jgi:hypothetical protein
MTESAMTRSRGIALDAGLFCVPGRAAPPRGEGVDARRPVRRYEGNAAPFSPYEHYFRRPRDDQAIRSCFTSVVVVMNGIRRPTRFAYFYCVYGGIPPSSK